MEYFTYFSCLSTNTLNKTQEKEFKSYVESIVYFANKKNDYVDFDKFYNTSKAKYKFDYSSRESTSLSLCHFHNYINYTNKDNNHNYESKDQFPCIMEYLEERWGNLVIIYRNF